MTTYVNLYCCVTLSNGSQWQPMTMPPCATGDAAGAGDAAGEPPAPRRPRGEARAAWGEVLWSRALALLTTAAACARGASRQRLAGGRPPCEAAMRGRGSSGDQTVSGTKLLGFGRIVAPEIEAPNRFVNMV